MRRDLWKGQSSVYLQYESCGGDTIGADQFEAALVGTTLVISLRLKPVDENQRIDERRLHSENLTEIHICNEHIINNLGQFLEQPRVAAQSMRARILSQGKTLDYAISFGAAGLGQLPLLVQRIAE